MQLKNFYQKLDFIHKTYKSEDPDEIEDVRYNLTLLSDEIEKELYVFGAENFPAHEELELGKFDDDTYEKTKEFIAVLKIVYINS